MEKTFKIKIIKCDNHLAWYANYIGIICVAKKLIDGNYQLIGSRHCIMKCDCIEVDAIPNKNKKESILIEANKIVNGDRNEQYGDAKEAFSVYSEICKSVFGLDLSPDDVCKVLMAVKLGRLKYKYKRDSVVDLCGYAEILSKLMEE